MKVVGTVAVLVALVAGVGTAVGVFDGTSLGFIDDGSDTVVDAVSPSPPVVADTATETAASPVDASAGATADSDVQPTALIPVGSARLSDRMVADVIAPVGLRIETIGVSAPVFAAGATNEDEMEVPEGVNDVAWYEYGASPGDAGSAVFAAHVDLFGQGPGVFFRLDTLNEGDSVYVEFEDGSEKEFVVRERVKYLKEDLDRERIFARDGDPTLTLITCGGGFNPSLRRYDSNVVVYAEPVEGDR